MTNVKNAYILKDGGIEVVPKQDSIAATSIDAVAILRRLSERDAARPHRQGDAGAKIRR